MVPGAGRAAGLPSIGGVEQSQTEPTPVDRSGSGVLRECAYLVEKGTRGRWAVVAGLAAVVSAFEVIGALLVVSMLSVVSTKKPVVKLPLLGDLHERFPGHSTRGVFIIAAVIVAVFFLVRGALYLIQSYLQNRVAQNTGVRISTRLLRNYLGMPYVVHLRRNSAELIRNVNAIALVVVHDGLVPVVGIATETFLVFGVLLVLVIKAPAATAITVAIVGPALFLLLRLVRRQLVASGTAAYDATLSSLRWLQQGFQGLRDIKLLGREDLFLQRFTDSQSQLARANYIGSALSDVPRVTIETLLILFILVFLAVSISPQGTAEDSMVVLGLFAYAVLRLLPSLNRIMTHLNRLKIGAAAIHGVHADLVELEAHAAATDAPPTPPLAFRSIDVRHVTYRYPEAADDSLADIDLTIERGEFIGIVGATGSGKSTLVDVILGLLPPTQGTVEIDGVDLQRQLRGWHPIIGMVPQALFLLDDTLRRNIAFGVPDEEIDEGRLLAAIRVAQLESFVSELPDGLETVVGERGIRLAGGQRQRVAIARALYHEPQVLIFDEGTSALDNLTEAQLIRALEELRGDRTIITVAHRLSTVRECDRIVLLHAGRVSDIGSFDDLVKRSPEFREMARTMQDRPPSRLATTPPGAG